MSPRTPETTHRRWLMCGVALVALSAAELFLLQAHVFQPSQLGMPFVLWFHPWVRLALDACAFGALMVLAPRLALAAVMICAIPIHVLLLTYHGYFRHAFTLSVLSSQSQEGLAVTEHVLQLIPWGITAGLCLALLAKLFLLRAGGPSPFRLRFRAAAALTMIVLYFGLIEVVQRTTPIRFHRIQKFLTVDDLGMAFGYLPAWWAEYYYLNDEAVLRRAIDRAKIRSDQLANIEDDIDLPTVVVVVQVESLDYNVIGLRAGGGRLPHS